MGIFVIVINCVLAILFAVCISYCESHKIRYIIRPDVKDIPDKRYQLLIEQCNRLCEEWRTYGKENDANSVAKFSMGGIVLVSFVKNALQLDKSQTIVAIISIILPIILLLLIVYFVNKNNHAYIEFKKNGRGQKSFPAIFSLFMSGIDKYSYIENVNEELNDMDKTLALLTERISAIKYLQRLEHKYIIHWLMCTTILATLLFVL